jgi:hypothetical protein
MTSYEISQRVKYMQERGYSNEAIESWIQANDKGGYYRYPDSYDRNNDSYDHDNGYTHSQQSYADRSDYARELYESGRIDRTQMAEMRMGA